MTPNDNAQKVCEGGCETHAEPVVSVIVRTASGCDWGKFDYCQFAISVDRKCGLIVTTIEGTPNAD